MKNQTTQDLSEQQQFRRAKREKLLSEGRDAYPVVVDRTTSLRELRQKYRAVPEGEGDGKFNLAPGEETQDVVAVAGRIMFQRNTGKLCFATLQEGDIVSVRGRVIASRRGELSVQAQSWHMASKALRPLPVAFADMNEEQRVRHRYTDLIMREDARKNAMTRIKVIAAVRKFLTGHDFVEVETPMLQTLHGGAAARPFITRSNALDMDLYLRIAPELYLKRCVVGGIERVFELNRNFRNEGVDSSHSPEFTMLETYQAWGTYKDGAKTMQELVQFCAKEVFGSTTVTLPDGTEYDFGGEWKVMEMYPSLNEALQRKFPGQPEVTIESSVEELKGIADVIGLKVPKDEGWLHGKLVEEIWEHLCSDQLYEPSRDVPTDPRPSRAARRHREVRPLRPRLRAGHRLLRTRRPSHPARTLRRPSPPRRPRRRRSHGPRRGLPRRDGTGHATNRRLRHGHRPPADGADRSRHPRDRPLPAGKAGGVGLVRFGWARLATLSGKFPRF